MSSRATPPNVTRSVPPRGARPRRCAALLSLGTLGALGSGCTIQTVGSQTATPETAATARPATPSPAATTAGAQPSSSNQERTALHSSVAANVGTVRGLFEAVDQALRDPGLSPKSKRAHEQASAKVHEARQALNSGKHRLAQDAANEARRLLAPAIGELEGLAKLPDAVLKALVAQAEESSQSTAGAVQALRATGNTTGLESYERASTAFTDAAARARAGDGRRALRGLEEGAGQLARGTIARWPTLRAP